MRAKDLRLTKRMIEAYQNAIELQENSDLSKIVSTWAQDIRVVWEEARALNRGTDHVQTHPINRLYASKVEPMTGGCKKSVIARSYRQALAMLEENGMVMIHDPLGRPNNRMEKLKGDRTGQHSVRINDQWRICFVWKADGPYEVEITDYH